MGQTRFPHRAGVAQLLSVLGSTHVLLEAAVIEMEFILFSAELVASNIRKRLLRVCERFLCPFCSLFGNWLLHQDNLLHCLVV